MKLTSQGRGAGTFAGAFGFTFWISATDVIGSGVREVGAPGGRLVVTSMQRS